MDDKIIKNIEDAYAGYSEKCQKVIALAGKLGLDKVSNLTHLEFNIGSATKTLKLAEGFLAMAKESLLANRKEEAKDLANKALTSLSGITEFECDQKAALSREIADFLGNLVSPEEKEALAKGNECDDKTDKAGESLNAGDFESAIRNAKEAKDLLKFIKDDTHRKELETHINNVIDNAAKALVNAKIANAASLAASQPAEAKQELEKARLLCDSVTDKARCLEQVAAAEKPLKLAELETLIKQARDIVSNPAATGEQLNQAKSIIENAAKLAEDINEEPKKKLVADLKAEVEKHLFSITVNTTLKNDIFGKCVYFSGDKEKAINSIPIPDMKELKSKKSREKVLADREKAIINSLAPVKAIIETVIGHYRSDELKKNSIKDLLKEKIHNISADVVREVTVKNITDKSVSLFFGTEDDIAKDDNAKEELAKYRLYMLDRVLMHLLKEIDKQ